jgi:hypothetical protein
MKTQITDETLLKKTLTAMGYEIVTQEKGVEVRGFFGETMPADFKILTKTHYDVGFCKNEEGNYEIVGDWDLLPKVSGLERESFTQKVSQNYAKTTIQETAKLQGYEVNCIEHEDGNLEMVVTQW